MSCWQWYTVICRTVVHASTAMGGSSQVFVSNPNWKKQTRLPTNTSEPPSQTSSALLYYVACLFLCPNRATMLTLNGRSCWTLLEWVMNSWRTKTLPTSSTTLLRSMEESKRLIDSWKWPKMLRLLLPLVGEEGPGEVQKVEDVVLLLLLLLQVPLVVHLLPPDDQGPVVVDTFLFPLLLLPLVSPDNLLLLFLCRCIFFFFFSIEFLFHFRWSSPSTTSPCWGASIRARGSRWIKATSPSAIKGQQTTSCTQRSWRPPG